MKTWAELAWTVAKLALMIVFAPVVMLLGYSPAKQ